MKANLTDVPETMLWTLHNRASEAARPDACLHDPKCIEIYRAIDYDYVRSFGKPEPSHAVRSAIFDRAIEEFLAKSPDGVIVNLGEGLETQRFRIDAPQALWLSVDLPEAMAVRERFISPDEQHLHLAVSALDEAWIDALPEGREVFITAQGLLMYFREEEVKRFFVTLAKRLPGAYFMFDHLNTMLSRRSVSPKGWMRTKHYRTPPMPWGIARNELAATLSRWLGQEIQLEEFPFRFPRGLLRWIVPVLELTGLVKHFPGVVRFRFPQQG